MNFSVSLVIPILNEADSLPELLDAIKLQTFRPDEIIFCDAGSNDGSASLIEAWWNSEGWEGGVCRVLNRPGAMPGAGRNAGVEVARNNWIAFIDGGITPASDWLEQLCQYANDKGVLAVFGVCYFTAHEAFPKAICSLSYGAGALHPVIPASLFARSVFENVGGFPASLRAGEDLIWMNTLKNAYGEREVCSKARVSYTHFPKSWEQAWHKWRITEFNCVIGGVRARQQFMYLICLPMLYALPFGDTAVGGIVFLSYLFIRGILDPIRRSEDMQWWGATPFSAVIALPLAAMLDIAKWVGIVQALKLKFFNLVKFRNE